MQLGRPVYAQLLIDKCSAMCFILRSAKHAPVRHCMSFLCVLKLDKGNAIFPNLAVQYSTEQDFCAQLHISNFARCHLSYPHSSKNLPWEKQKAFQSFLAFQECTAKVMPVLEGHVKKNHASRFPLSLRHWSKTKWAVRSLNIFMYLNPAQWVHRWVERGSTLEQPRKYNFAWCSVLPCCPLKYKTWQTQM